MTLEAVSRMPMVVPEARSLRNVIDRACTILGVNLNLVAESDSTTVILDLVLRGVGYTILPVIPIMTMLAEKRIEGAPIISPTLQRTVIIGTAVLNRNPRLVNALHAELIRVLEPYIKQFENVGVRWLAD
ncbi:LysR substrate binding domain protein [compost metagenome]